MKAYEKPQAELVQFETEEILLDLYADIGITPSAEAGVEDWD